jgi:hypothetical protein
VLVLASGCGDGSDLQGNGGEEEGTKKITVSLRNTGAQSIYIAGDRMPFQVKDGAGKIWPAAPPPCGFSCGRCSDFCKEPWLCDSVPCYLEVPAGQTVSLTWNGLVYESGSCPCNSQSCYSAKALARGKHTFVIPYSRTLSAKGSGSTYSKAECSELPVSAWGSIVGWMASGFGTATFGQSLSLPVAYKGQGKIELTLQ